MKYQCKCGVGYISLTGDITTPGSQITGAENIQLHKGIVLCASCNEEIIRYLHERPKLSMDELDTL